MMANNKDSCQPGTYTVAKRVRRIWISLYSFLIAVGILLYIGSGYVEDMQSDIPAESGIDFFTSIAQFMYYAFIALVVIGAVGILTQALGWYSDSKQWMAGCKRG